MLTENIIEKLSSKVIYILFVCLFGFSFFHYLVQRFSTGVPQAFLKHVIPDYLVKGTDLFSLRWSNKKKNDSSQHNNSYLVWTSQIIPIIFVRSSKNRIYFLVCHRILVISLVYHEMRKFENCWFSLPANEETEKWMRVMILLLITYSNQSWFE